MKLIVKLILSAALVSQLAACVPAVLGGAAVGGSMAADRRTSGIYIEDENIELKASRKISVNLTKKSHVSVTSFNRNVMLTGQAADAEQRALAEMLVKEVEHVRNINNELTVGPNTGLKTRSNDTYITSKVKTKFLTGKHFNANNVKVVTEDGVVFLMGLVTQEEGNAAAEIARNVVGVSKVVKVFEYLN